MKLLLVAGKEKTGFLFHIEGLLLALYSIITSRHLSHKMCQGSISTQVCTRQVWDPEISAFPILLCAKLLISFCIFHLLAYRPIGM